MLRLGLLCMFVGTIVVVGECVRVGGGLQVSLFQQIVHGLIDIPWPFSSRDMVPPRHTRPQRQRPRPYRCHPRRCLPRPAHMYASAIPAQVLDGRGFDLLEFGQVYMAVVAVAVTAAARWSIVFISHRS